MIDAVGDLVGLMTSNARHSKTGRTIANLNFSLPANLLQPLFAMLAKHPHLGESIPQQQLDALDVTSTALQQMWGRQSFKAAL